MSFRTKSRCVRRHNPTLNHTHRSSHLLVNATRQQRKTYKPVHFHYHQLFCFFFSSHSLLYSTMPAKKIPQDPKCAREGNNHMVLPNKPIPDVSPRPEAKAPMDISLCEPNFRTNRTEITCQAQLLDHVRMNVNGSNAEDFNSARQTTQEMRAYRRGE